MQGKILTILIALAFAVPTFAQNAGNATQPMRTGQQNLPNRAASQQMNTQNTIADSDFDKMDKKHQGYLMPADVASIKKVSANFKSCDKNHDGRLSREEYDACSAGM